MTAPKHTPTPWQPSNLWIGDNGNGPYAYPLGTDPDEAAANANYLCRAVNMHDRLVVLAELVAANAYMLDHPEWRAMGKQARALLDEVTRS